MIDDVPIKPFLLIDSSRAEGTDRDLLVVAVICLAERPELHRPLQGAPSLLATLAGRRRSLAALMHGFAMALLILRAAGTSS